MYKTIEELVTRVDERNNDGIVSELIGVSIDKCFIKSVANTNGTDLSKYKIIRKNDFAVSLMQVSRDGKIPIARLEEYEEAIMSPAYPIFRVKDKNIILPEYLEMWFKRPEFDREAAFIAVGGVRGSMPWKEFAKMKLPVPPIKKQRKIVNAYKIVTDRIALKQKINDNLADELNTIYSKWFENFESPFASTQKEESELGNIPLGWKVAELGEFIESYSKTHQFNKDKLIFLNTSDILSGVFLNNAYMQVADMPGQAKKEIRQGDILFSEIRPANKRYALVTFPADDYVVSTKLMVLRTTQNCLSNLRFYHLLTMDKTLNKLHREADGKSGTFPQITFDENLRHRKFIVADDQTEQQFEYLLQAYYKLNKVTQQEIKYLEQAKSILLSKLSH
ncbi:restriction endonuclease subunit S [Lachnospiraceae bacterium AM25-27]|nr:restriction endonuclease subunit S [Lachnospiraceae bacterium AM25-27]